MVTRYRVTFGQNNSTVQFDEFLKNHKTYGKYKDKIVILDLKYSAPEFNRTIETPGDTDGGIITRTYKQKASVSIVFGLYIYDTQDRSAVCDLIKTLASKGGNIYTSDRPGKALYNCFCEKFPEIDSAKDWTAPITMTFSTIIFPYWKDDHLTAWTLEGKSRSYPLDVPGNAPSTPCSVEFVAKEDFPKITDVKKDYTTIGINGTYLRISYAFKKNNYCVIDYDSEYHIRVRVASTKSSKSFTSILDKVLPSSSDRLLAKPGQANRIEISALKEITATFTVRGAWL